VKLGTISDRTEILMACDVIRLTTVEVSAATGVAPATLRKWACLKTAGTLQPAGKRANRNLYRPSDVRRWLGVDEAWQPAPVGAPDL
jgi:hypothetical protein